MESAKRASGNNCVESEFFFFKKRGSKGGKEEKSRDKTLKVQFRKKSRIFHSFFFHDAHE